jgi:putative flavoprotein involved in K+ transport
MASSQRFQTVVIGAGQAGLSVGYELARRGISFVILDAHERVGDAWRKRWDSLRLFTPSRYDGLPGMPFPASWFAFPTKDEMADYLERYARHFQLPVETGTRVDRLARNGKGYVVSAGGRRFEADHVVVAMSSFQTPRIPAFASELSPDIKQVTAYDYANPSQLREGGVLIVGAANSGAEIALDVAPTHHTWLAGRDVGQVPFRIDGRIARIVLPFLFRVIFHRLLTVKTPMGRVGREKALKEGGARIRTKSADLDAAGVERVPRMRGVVSGRPVLEDGRVLDVANVIWSTGYGYHFSWIDLPIHGPVEPKHEAGVVPSEPGLYFVGLLFLYSVSSTMVHGVGRDAARIADTIHGRIQRS